MKQAGKTFLSAVMAGMCIAMGGLVFLPLENKVLGAVFFAIGLFTICSFRLHLFTGKVCYVFDNDARYALLLPVIWLGNLAGTFLIAQAARLTRAASLAEKAAAIWQIKLSDSLLSLFLLGVLCNILIYIAVECYNTLPSELGKHLALFFGVTVFILAGTEHCVADMFYLFLSGNVTADAFGRLLIITLGNAVGSVIFPLLRKAAK